MTTDRAAYDTLQTAMARQRVTVYDLYGILDTAPNADQDAISAAYDAIVKKSRPGVPSNVINTAHAILTNPYKRAQYDRDRLEYLYKHFSRHESFPAADTDTTRDEQIQVYATTLAARVTDPTEAKRGAIVARIARTRNDLDDFQARSARHRQDWATSPNQILRMAANALREIVVCAEADLNMLEDELGRLDGTLAPRDTDGPAGRVTSGAYGSGGGGGAGAKHSVLANQRVPSIPRSPTVPLAPKSASKLGVQGDADSSGSEGVSDAQTEILADDRVNHFLLGPIAPATALRVPQSARTTGLSSFSAAKYTSDASRSGASSATTVKKSPTPSPSEFDRAFPPVGSGMGLVEWQKLNGATVPEDNPFSNANLENNPVWAAAVDSMNPFVRATMTQPYIGGVTGSAFDHRSTSLDLSHPFPLYSGSGRQITAADLARSAISQDFRERVWSVAHAAKGGADGATLGEAVDKMEVVQEEDQGEGADQKGENGPVGGTGQFCPADEGGAFRRKNGLAPIGTGRPAPGDADGADSGGPRSAGPKSASRVPMDLDDPFI